MPWDFEELYTYMVRNDDLGIKNLLCRGVDVDSRGNLGQSLLHEAAKSGNI
jgi:ankyrin repeat protein